MTAQLLFDNESDAQDLVQETFLRAYHTWRQCQSSPGCRLWLYKTMATVFLKKYRLSWPLSAAIHSADSGDGSLSNFQSANEQPIDDSGQVLLRAMSRDVIAETIRVLPEELRICTVLSLIENFTYQEISYIAGVNIETISSRLHAGSKLLLRTLCIEKDSGRQERLVRDFGLKSSDKVCLVLQNNI